MGHYLRLLKYLRPYMLRISIAIGCTVLATGGHLVVPWLIKDMIDEVLVQRDYATLNMLAIVVVAVYFARGVFFFGQSYLMAYAGQRVVIDIRADVYRQINRLSLSFFEKNRTGAIMSYVTNDVAALQGAMIQSVIDLFTEGVVLLGSIAAMLVLNWKLTLFTFATFPAVLKIIEIFGGKIRASGHRIQERNADLTSVLQEAIASVRVVKSFVREKYEIEKFEKENLLNFRASMKNAQLGATLTPVIEFTVSIGATGILWYGGREVIAGDTTAGALIAFLIYAVNIANPIKRLAKVFADIQKAMAAAQRVFNILDMPPDVVDKPGAYALPPVKGEVEFKNVVFGYNPGEPVVNNVSFKAGAGKLVAIVGPSGAGKTTIASLLSRFYDIDSGQILIDGINIKDVTTDSLRGQIGIVPQETVLFNGSIYNNILYGRLDASKEEIEAAALSANADGFIRQIPGGYGALLGDRGVNLSGGQRQRISIARAILKNPRILILDEATSALDAESEKIVQEALDRLLVGRTSFVIAHRLSTIRRADSILVLDKGRLVEEGSHDSLLLRGGLYTRLYQAQFAKARVTETASAILNL
ncbi:MAG: ABC transporter ATP-binding protein/permease [Acidaminococcales bacterium]|jgi:subfamily B ATP-binding cassette protein MsbA|nr:ABC transporter ATP-binding protein/permease [Acidaminococcales bacterium]